MTDSFYTNIAMLDAVQHGIMIPKVRSSGNSGVCRRDGGCDVKRV